MVDPSSSRLLEDFVQSCQRPKLDENLRYGTSSSGRTHLRTIARYMQVRILLSDIATVLPNDNTEFHFVTVLVSYVHSRRNSSSIPS